MIDWLTVLIALVIIAALVVIFGFMAWKINMPDPLLTTTIIGKKDDLIDSINDKKKRDKHGNDQSKNKRKDKKKSKRDTKEEDQQHNTVHFKEPSIQTSEETDNEREESEQVNYDFKKIRLSFYFIFILGIICTNTRSC
jgi:hypothetical protein